MSFYAILTVLMEIDRTWMLEAHLAVTERSSSQTFCFVIIQKRIQRPLLKKQLFFF